MKRSLLSAEILIIILVIAALCWLTARKVNAIRAQAAAAASKENITMLQDAVHVYRWDHEGHCPVSLAALIPGYLENIPPAYKTLSMPNNSVKYGPYREVYDGSGGWVFVNTPAQEHYCEVFLNI